MEKIKKVSLLIFFVGILAVTGEIVQLCLVYSQDIYQKSVAQDSAEINVGSGVVACPTVKLSLDDATKLALRNSLDVQIAKFDAYIKQASLGEAESIFDTFLTVEASYDHDKQMDPIVSSANRQTEVFFSAGVEKKLPTGTTVTLDAANSRSNTNSSTVITNPYNEASAQFGVVQQLGRNFFGLADRSQIKITKIDIENSELISLDDIENCLADVQIAYWSFVLKTKELAIAEDMLKQSEQLYNIYKEKYSLGLAERSDFLAVEALMYTRKNEVEVEKLVKETEKNNLLFLINNGDFSQNLEAEDVLDCSLEEVSLAESLKDAISHRRDYERIANDLRKNGIEIVVKKNALWPQIDLSATYSRNNIAGNRRKSWEDISQNSNDEVLVKIDIKFPLENREAKSSLEQESINKQRILLELKKVERNILREINNNVSKVNTLIRQVKLFQFTVGLHKEKLAEQIKRVNYGRSNSDILITYEQDLLNARLQLATYYYRYRVSLVELELFKNSLLDKYWTQPL